MKRITECCKNIQHSHVIGIWPTFYVRTIYSDQFVLFIGGMDIALIFNTLYSSYFRHFWTPSNSLIDAMNGECKNTVLMLIQDKGGMPTDIEANNKTDDQFNPDFWHCSGYSCKLTFI